MMEWKEPDVVSLAVELVETGLATPGPYSHLTLDPALCPWLSRQMDVAERESLTNRWADAMYGSTVFLARQRSEKVEIATELTLPQLPKPVRAARPRAVRRERRGHGRSRPLSCTPCCNGSAKPRLLERVARARDCRGGGSGPGVNHARFEVQRTRIEQQLNARRLREALDGAQETAPVRSSGGGDGLPGCRLRPGDEL
jgi:hypothetical protein